MYKLTEGSKTDDIRVCACGWRSDSGKPHLCHCGCGRPILNPIPRFPSRPLRQFIFEHYSNLLKGRKRVLSQQHIESIRKSQENIPPERRIKISAKLSESRKRLFASGYINPLKGRKRPPEIIAKLVAGHMKSDYEIGINVMHRRVRGRKSIPEFCEMCNRNKPYDLANITGVYTVDLSNWKYMCRSCHVKFDYENGDRKRSKVRTLKGKGVWDLSTRHIYLMRQLIHWLFPIEYQMMNLGCKAHTSIGNTEKRQCYECGSYDTLIYKPHGNHRKPFPRWMHLPWDKTNFYCDRCYQRIKYRWKGSLTTAYKPSAMTTSTVSPYPRTRTTRTSMKPF